MVQFVNDDPAVALAEFLAKYKALANRELQTGDPEYLVAATIADQIAKVRTEMNVTGNQNLLAYATGAGLDEIAAKFGTYRLEPSPAKVKVRFTMVGGAPDTVIFAGSKVKSLDGKAIFETDADAWVQSGIAYVDINCTCVVNGEVGNGYTAGLINATVDYIGYVASVANTETSTGGSGIETDEALRARVKLASSTFSVAGPTDAYIYFAKTADSSIVDVSTKTDPPGTVNVYVLLNGGIPAGSAVLDAVEALLNDRKIRPLSDTVNVLAPTQVDFDLTINLTVKKGYNSAQIQSDVTRLVTDYINKVKNRMGIDVVVNTYRRMAMVDGVYDVAIPTLSGNITVDRGEFAVCGVLTVNVVAIVDEE